MNSRKITHSIALFGLLLGGISPVVQATETSSSSSVEIQTNSPSSATTSSMETNSELPTSTDIEESNSSSTREGGGTLSGAVTTETATPRVIDSQAQPELIVGTDEQTRVENTTDHPYRAIVHLVVFFGDGLSYNGTGVLVAPNLVLTVAHNVYKRETNQWAYSVTVTPGKNGALNPFGVYAASNFYIPSNFKSASGNAGLSYDIAVIRLDSSVPETVGYLPVSLSQTVGEHIELPGYPAYTASKAHYMYTSFGEIDEFLAATSGMPDYLISYTIDTESGNSGSPILNSSNQVIGIHSSGISENEDLLYGSFNIGRRVDQLTLDLMDIAANKKSMTTEVSSNHETKTSVVYRLYDPKKQYYFYTRSLDEAAILKNRGWNFEGKAFLTGDSGQPVYRLYNAERQTYFFTTNEVDKNSIVTNGWKYEGIAWYSAGSRQVFRFFNPDTKVHIYTSSSSEVNLLHLRGWKYEGIAFYTVNN